MVEKIKHIPTNEVHILRKDGKTGCGFDIEKKSTYWIKVGRNTKVTCSKN